MQSKHGNACHMMISRYFIAALAALLVGLPACQQYQYYTDTEAWSLEALEARLEYLDEHQPEAPEEMDPRSYEYFISHRGYPLCMTVHHKDELMSVANSQNARIVICLTHQRGRLYVEGQVAADWPVSTGVEGRATTVGEYTVLEKKKQHASGRFGVIKDAAGNIVESEADSRVHTMQPGQVWEGSAMPNWMRLTDYGMGMHTGEVKAGTRLSHGCIRMPHFIAERIFDIVEPGFPVTVTDELEPEFPSRDVLVQFAPYNSWYMARREVQEKVDALHRLARERAEAEEQQPETTVTPAQETPAPLPDTPQS